MKINQIQKWTRPLILSLLQRLQWYTFDLCVFVKIKLKYVVNFN